MSEVATTVPVTGQWFPTPEGTRWWFDSGSLALDFAYTGRVADETPEDQPGETLHSAADLTAWLAGRLPSAAASARDLADAIRLRGAISGLARAASAGIAGDSAEIDLLNLYAATPDIPPALTGGTRRAGRSTARPAQALSAMAREAIDLFSETELIRFRECAADDCQLIFYDESRSNNRRWCSMQRCGNRAKVRAHRSKSRA